MNKDNNSKNDIKENNARENCATQEENNAVAKDWDRDPKKIGTTTQKGILRKIFKK